MTDWWPLTLTEVKVIGDFDIFKYFIKRGGHPLDIGIRYIAISYCLRLQETIEYNMPKNHKKSSK